MSPQDVA